MKAAEVIADDFHAAAVRLDHRDRVGDGSALAGAGLAAKHHDNRIVHARGISKEPWEDGALENSLVVCFREAVLLTVEFHRSSSQQLLVATLGQTFTNQGSVGGDSARDALYVGGRQRGSLLEESGDLGVD